ncbi:MAG: polymer-forming cytoskeletal protein [Endomicrobiaceae bacterium]|jgi:cytoskeletal protein CcmA (bactofilin family)|nr:polymer-forming cytoskeletal protein [Endomicrobiaceae bacterium]MDD3729902.1 polymer-forming cytoskeletal protein [Endomicrobiaceae bacterium]MDD4166082.1 polymer-forming cytoskeletal protein [Endomicrobiaceae bacterium]
MTKKNKFDTIETFIGQNTVLNGNISTEKTIRIDGKMTGNIENSAGVIIGDAASLKGDINSNYVLVSGTVEGNITATEYVELFNKSKIIGNIQTKMISISEGAVFEGRSLMLNNGENSTVNTEKEAD